MIKKIISRLLNKASESMVEVQLMDRKSENENLKLEIKELKKRLKEIGKEIDNQISELSKPCAITPKNINNASPVSGNITDISEAYNRSANTERLTYKQKLEMIKLVHQKGTIKD